MSGSCITHLSSALLLSSSSSAVWFILQSPAGCNKEKKNPKSHKSIKGNNSKQREGNDPGLLLLKGGEKHVHACSFSSFCPRHTHFPTCRWSCTPGRRRRTGKAESRPILDQTGNSVLPQCEATIPSAALLSPSPDYNVRNLGSGLEDWQSPTT